MDQVYIGTTSFGRHWLDRPAADSWVRMVRDGCPAAGITDAGRTQQEQIDVFLKYFTTDFATSAKFDPRGWQGRTYWRRIGKPSAATPGSVQARHTFGRALDLNGATKAWVRANGHRYGWIKDLVGGEDWHMEYQPTRDVVLVTNPGTSTGTVPTVPNLPPLTPIEEIDMPSIEEVTDAVGERVKAILRSDEFGRNRALAIAGESAAAVWEYPVTGIDPTKALMAAEVLRDARVAKELHEKVAALGVSVAGIASPTIDPAALAAALAPLVSVGLTEAQVVAAVRSVFADAGRTQ